MSSRRSSLSSSGRSSPEPAAIDASRALILVNDDGFDGMTSAPFELYSDDEDDLDSPPYDIRHRLAYIQPLTPSAVFAYLLSPYLKLGAMLLPNTELPLNYGISSLVVFAILSALARHLWYMLSRYTRRADLEDIIAEVVAKGRGREDQRAVVRTVIRSITGLMRVLLGTLYLHESASLILPFLPTHSLPVFLAETIITAAIGFLILPLALAHSLGSKRVVYATWLSLLTYVVWLAFAIYAHANGLLRENSSWMRLGTFWQAITTTAFTFTSGSTLSLYASLKAGNLVVTTAKSSTPRSFKTLCLASSFAALGLTLPLAFLAASPNRPVMKDARSSYLEPTLAILNALTLLLSIPAIIAATPTVPISERIRQSVRIPLSKLVIFTIIVLLSLLPQSLSSVLSDIVIALSLGSTFTLPAFLHICTHFIRRPLAMIIPTSPNPFSQPPDSSGLESPPNSANDPLLQRKEHALQRRQLQRRLFWDVGVWVALVPLSVGGFAWSIGALMGKW